MKTFLPLVGLTALLTSCVVVRFPTEVKIHVAIPEQMTKEQIDQLVDQIPKAIKDDKLKATIEVSSSSKKEN